MGTLSNTPQSPTMMILASRKSFSFTVQFLADNGLPLDLESSTASFTIGEQVYSDTPILTLPASSVDPVAGEVLFELQAHQLDLRPGVYPYEIVLLTEGYSTIAISGELEIVESYEMGSVAQTYDGAPDSFSLIANVKNNRVVVTASGLVLQGPKGEQGEPGVDGNPFEFVGITYDAEGRIASLLIDEQTTSYTYNSDDTIAFDERNGVTRRYIYTDGMLTSIEPQTGI